MVSLKNWWTLPRKKHKPTSWSPLYTVYFTLMDLGESNKFIINRSTPISTFLSSRILHESKKKHHWECGVPTGCVELPQQKTSIFSKHHGWIHSFINDSSQLSSHERIFILPCMFFARSHACNLLFWSWPKESMMQTIRSKDRIWDSVFQPQGNWVEGDGVQGWWCFSRLESGDPYKVGPATFG